MTHRSTYSPQLEFLDWMERLVICGRLLRSFCVVGHPQGNGLDEFPDSSYCSKTTSFHKKTTVVLIMIIHIVVKKVVIKFFISEKRSSLVWYI